MFIETNMIENKLIQMAIIHYIAKIEMFFVVASGLGIFILVCCIIDYLSNNHIGEYSISNRLINKYG